MAMIQQQDRDKDKVMAGQKAHHCCPVSVSETEMMKEKKTRITMMRMMTTRTGR